MKEHLRPLYQQVVSTFLAFALLGFSQLTLAQRNEPARKERTTTQQVRRPSEPRRETPQRPSTLTPQRRATTTPQRQQRTIPNRSAINRPPVQQHTRSSTIRPPRTAPSVRVPQGYRPRVYHQTYRPRNYVHRPPYRHPYRPTVYNTFHYHYHPYIPFYEWGFWWHPIGAFIDVLPLTAIVVGFSATTISGIDIEETIYYDEGVFYQREANGYDVIAPPLGAIVPSLPEDTFEFSAEGILYYYYAGVFYTPIDDGYQVVQAPLGAIVSKLPPGATEVKVEGRIYYYINDTFYQPINTEDGPAYQVVDL